MYKIEWREVPGCTACELLIDGKRMYWREAAFAERANDLERERDEAIRERDAARARLALVEPVVEAAQYLRPAVARFARIMEDQLRDHDDRPGWSTCTRHWLLRRLRDEVRELQYAHDLGQERDIPLECADVANFAMMIADNALRAAHPEEVK